MNDGQKAPLDRKSEPRPSPISSYPTQVAPAPASSRSMSDRAAPPNLAQALDHSEVMRMRAFYAYGIVASSASILQAFVFGGDARARLFFQAGMAWTILVNVVGLLLGRSKLAREPRFVTTHVLFSSFGMVPVFYYFGPFSLATVVHPVALMFIALSGDRRMLNLVVATALGEYVLAATPVTLGWTADVGLVSSFQLQRFQLVTLEVMALGFMIAAYAMGRWARHTSSAALAELANANQIIGDQNQLLGEVKAHVDMANRAKTGRWSRMSVGPWRLGSLLGRGAMGEVYEAQNEQGQEAAVKVLTSEAQDSPSLVERFDRELRIAANLESPHIVQVLGISSPTDVVQYLAMERLRGEDLASRLRSEIRMPLNEVVGMLRQVASGLEVAHKAGVVHRDLKPHNLFLHDNRCWKILDFGVAKVFGGEGTLTQDMLIGTPQYMAPEQALGEAITPLTDVYALGAIAYRCLTGRTPYGGKELNAMLLDVMRSAPVRPGSLAELSRDVENVLAVAMAKQPKQRFATATEFVEQLAHAAEMRPVKVEPPVGAWA